MTTGWRVLKTLRTSARTFLPSAPNSGPRWSIVGRLIARRMRSGTGLGPGICRKWRPVGWKSRSSMTNQLAAPFLHPAASACRAFVLATRARRGALRVQESPEDEAAMLIDRPERLVAAAAAPKGTRLPASEVAVTLARRLRDETEGEVCFDA